MTEEQIIDVMEMMGFQNIVTNNEWVNCSCPFAEHSDTHKGNYDSNPSFGISIQDTDLSIANCFTCGNRGPVAAIVTRLSHLEKVDYSKQILTINKAELDGNKVDSFEGRIRRNRKRITKLPEPMSLDYFNQKYPSAAKFRQAVDYLRARGVNRVGAEKADLRYCSFEERVLFPYYHHDGKLYGFSGRTVLEPENYHVFEGGRYQKIRDNVKKSHFLLGINNFKGLPILVFEGLMSYAYLLSIGADKYFDLACISGADLSDSQAKLLIQLNRPVYALPDNDIAGDKCLFGDLDDNQEHKGGGLLDKLEGHVPVYLPEWPLFQEGDEEYVQGEDTEKVDCDQLTLDEVKFMLDNAECQ